MAVVILMAILALEMMATQTESEASQNGDPDGAPEAHSEILTATRRYAGVRVMQSTTEGDAEGDQNFDSGQRLRGQARRRSDVIRR
jgi:Ni/Co efflux regulator RcnB